MACNENCLTLEQLYNVLDNYNFSSNVVPVGARVTVGLDTFNTYFDASSGLGADEWEGWALSNGANGTVNRLGKFCAYYDPSDTDFSGIDTVSGQKTNTLTSSELPAHTHTHGIAAHTHSVNDPGHSHSVSTTTALSGISMGPAGAGTYTVNSSGYSITLNKQQLRIEDSVAPTNPKDIEIYVPAVNLQSYGGLTSGTEAETITGSGTVTVPLHTHSLPLSHTHTNTVGSATTGISVNANSASLGGSVTGSSGSGQPFTNLPPYIVEVPVEKIS